MGPARHWLGDPQDHWLMEVLGYIFSSALPAFVTSNPDTLTAGQTPTEPVLQLDPADGKDLTKAPCGKALLQGGEF